MTAAEFDRLPLRRVKRCRVIRTETRVPTQPIVFVVPPRTDLVAALDAYLRGQP